MKLFCDQAAKNIIYSCLSDEIEMIDIDGIAMESLIEFCYSGCIDIHEHNASALLEAASLFQLQEIQVSKMHTGLLFQLSLL